MTKSGGRYDYFTDEEYFLVLKSKNARATLVDQEGHLIGVWTGPMRKLRARLWAWVHGYTTIEPDKESNG